jgi:hypothetical protein
VTINLPVCPEDCPEYFAPDFWINLDLVRMGGDINVRITDDTGRAIAVSRANQDKHLVSFQPEGGRHYKAQIHFGSETRGALYATLSSNQATTVETVPTTSERR